MYCKFCGSQIDDNSTFCKHCGSKISSDENLTFHQESIDLDNPEQALNWLKSLSIEEQALQNRKKCESSRSGCIIELILFLIDIAIGIFVAVKYINGSDYIITIIEGVALGVVSMIPIVIFIFGKSLVKQAKFDSKWYEYNQIIARAEFKTDIQYTSDKQSSCTDMNDKDRMRQLIIEKKLKDGTTLGNEEFEWHSSRWCWGCGKKHIKEPSYYMISAEKSTTQRKKMFYITTTKCQIGTVPLCPECYKRLTAGQKNIDKNISKIQFISNCISCAGICISIIYFLVFIVLDVKFNFGMTMIYTICDAIACYTMITLVLHWYGFDLTGLILAVILPNNNDISMETKWNLKNIPSIKRYKGI